MPTKTKTQYKVLTAGEQLATLRDQLRDAEMTHYRLAIASPADPTRDERLILAYERVVELQEDYDRLIKEADDEAG